jgi:restriction system protein
MWGVHNDQPGLELVDRGFISIGWARMGDLSALADDREDAKAAVAARYPSIKPGAIPVWAGTLLRFVHRMAPGDLVVYPHKPDRTLNFGRITGGYEYHPEAAVHPHRRAVRWLHTGVPREHFSDGALYEVGSSITVFRIRRHLAEFLAII